MSRKCPKPSVIKALFAHSGNQCAFEGCNQQLINHKNQFIGQICHIEAASPGGERYNPESNDEERRGYDNLILFCYPHHIETNDTVEFTVEKLKQIKQNHARAFKDNHFNLSEKQLTSITNEISKYWEEVEFINKFEHIYPDLAMEVSGDRQFLDITANLRELIGKVENILSCLGESDVRLEQDFKDLLRKQDIDIGIFDEVDYYENPFINRNWESHNLSVPNLMQKIKIDLLSVEIKFLEEYLKNNSDDQDIKEYFYKL
ncbi:hypothetical protein [Psychrobacter sp. FDAARGOS_221]|uniref:hypothetical protein n=1 Tax=Psychrobacter sp. FDAARGOS_221 TaxID=1975705 RepID=UPI000BB586CE|nr:hypothetical protein [Psychrobacter sp. FDAARGOS_221]PNK60889.1 hypothetical protein A6J60_008370 [Psychrobacter sp. FDAARGOS_221]